jgi:hypothetical protein
MSEAFYMPWSPVESNLISAYYKVLGWSET